MLAARAAKAPTTKTEPPANKATPGRGFGTARSTGRGLADPGQVRETPASPAWSFEHTLLSSPDRPSYPPLPRPGFPQMKLAIGAVDDPLEHEADRVAARVMSGPAPNVPISPAAPRLSRQCAACEEEEGHLQMKSVGAQPTNAAAPPIVHDVLRSPGDGLSLQTRAFFEPRFGRDFSHVRVHSDARAAESARAVGALGYTVGEHIVLANGPAGTHALMAHELAHVVQQTGAPRTGAPPVLRRFAPCRHLLDAKEKTPVAESAVQQSIASQAAGLGTVERELGLPAGSAAPMRTEPNKRRGGDVIDPQIISEDGVGKVDVAVLTGNALEIIEVKRAEWPDATFAEAQLLNYVSKGNRAIRDVERIWQNRGHAGDKINSVRAMRTNRLVPETPQRIAGSVVSLAWCRDGVLSFKAIGDQDQDVFVCGVKDQGRIDGFLNRAIDPAQAAVERFISREIEAKAAKVLSGLSLRDLLRRVIALPQVRRLVPGGSVFGEEQILDVLAQQLAPYEAEIRALAQSFLHRVIADIRKRAQAQLRAWLTEAMAALCAKTAEMTIRELLDAFEKGMHGKVLELIPVAVEAVAAEMMAELLSALGEAILEALKIVVAAVVVVIVAILLWEVAAAIIASEALVTALGAIGTFIARLLATLIPAFA